MSYSWASLSGALYTNPELSDEARFISTQMMSMHDLVDPATDFHLGKQSGDSIAYRLVGRITADATTALGEFQKVPMSKPPTYEGSAQVFRRGLAVPWTGVREDLDRLDVQDTIVHALQEHSARTHNTLIYNALVTGRSFCYSATAATTATITTNGTPSGTAAANFNGWHARNISRHMMKYNVPKFDGANYVGAISPQMNFDLFNDTATSGFVDVKKYTSLADGLLNGEVGTYFGIRYVADNHVLPDSIGSGSAFGSGIFVGYEAAKEVVVYPMHLLANLNLGSDFGNQKAIAWLSMLTYKTVWNYTSHGQGTVLHYTTA